MLLRPASDCLTGAAPSCSELHSTSDALATREDERGHAVRLRLGAPQHLRCSCDLLFGLPPPPPRVLLGAPQHLRCSCDERTPGPTSRGIVARSSTAPPMLLRRDARPVDRFHLAGLGAPQHLRCSCDKIHAGLQTVAHINSELHSTSDALATGAFVALSLTRDTSELHSTSDALATCTGRCGAARRLRLLGAPQHLRCSCDASICYPIHSAPFPPTSRAVFIRISFCARRSFARRHLAPRFFAGGFAFLSARAVTTISASPGRSHHRA